VRGSGVILGLAKRVVRTVAEPLMPVDPSEISQIRESLDKLVQFLEMVSAQPMEERK
jgi:hypothetical protein